MDIANENLGYKKSFLSTKAKVIDENGVRIPYRRCGDDPSGGGCNDPNYIFKILRRPLAMITQKRSP